MCLQYESFENTVGKGKIACNEQFLRFQQCFLPLWRTFHYFIEFEIVVCKLFQFGRAKNLSFGKELTHYHTIPQFEALKIYSGRKHCEKRRNCL